MAGGSYEVSAGSIAGYLAPLFLVLALLVALGIRRYARQPTFTVDVYVSCCLAYFFSFGILILVPVDLALAITGRREENLESYEDNVDRLVDVYATFFGFCFVLYTLVIVLQQHIIDSGYFTSGGRFLDAIRSWAIFTAMMGVAGLIVLIVVATSGNVAAGDAVLLLAAVAISISNTVGLIAIVFLLGYALVEFPRSLAYASMYHEQLLKVQMAYASELKELRDARQETTQLVADVHATVEEARRVCDQETKTFAEVVLSECPEGFGSRRTGVVVANGKGLVTVKELAGLRRRVKWNHSFLLGATRRCEALATQAYRIEDITKSKEQDKVAWSPLFFDGEEGSRQEHRWLLLWRPWLLRLGAFLAGVMSFFVLLGQIGMMVGYDSGASIWSEALHADNASGGAIVCFAMFTLGYCTYLVFWALFRVRLSFAGQNYMEIAPEQQTTAYSLLMNAYFCTRLCPPLAFYYTSLVFESGIFDGAWLEDASGRDRPTAFAKFYGATLEVVPFIGDNFNIFFPVLILCLSVLQALNVLNRCFVLLRLPQLQFGDPVPDEALLMESRRQLGRERTQREAAVERNKHRRRMSKLRKKPLGGEGPADASPARSQRRRSRVELEVKTREEPATCEGVGEKKGAGVLRTGGMWRTFRFELAGGKLLWWPQKASTTGPPEGEILITDVVEVDYHRDGRQGAKDSSRVDLLVGAEEHKFRFETEKDASRWLDALVAWKDYTGACAELMSTTSEEYLVAHERDVQEAKAQLDVESPPNRRPSALLDAIRIEDFTSGPDIVPGRPIGEEPSVVEGYLKVGGAKSLRGRWKDRWCVVDALESALRLYASSGALRQSVGSIDLVGATIQPYEKDGRGDADCRFTIVAGEERMKLKAKSKQEAQYWMRQLGLWASFHAAHAQ